MNQIKGEEKEEEKANKDEDTSKSTKYFNKKFK